MLRRPPAVFISRFFWSSASKHSYDTEFDLRKNVPGNNLRVPRYDSSLIYSTYDLKPIDLYLLSNTIQLFSERPNRPKLSSAEPRSFGQLHRSFGPSFGRIFSLKMATKYIKFFSKNSYTRKIHFYKLNLNSIWDNLIDSIHFLIGMKI